YGGSRNRRGGSRNRRGGIRGQRGRSRGRNPGRRRLPGGGERGGRRGDVARGRLARGRRGGRLCRADGVVRGGGAGRSADPAPAEPGDRARGGRDPRGGGARGARPRGPVRRGAAGGRLPRCASAPARIDGRRGCEVGGGTGRRDGPRRGSGVGTGRGRGPGAHGSVRRAGAGGAPPGRRRSESVAARPVDVHRVAGRAGTRPVVAAGRPVVAAGRTVVVDSVRGFPPRRRAAVREAQRTWQDWAVLRWTTAGESHGPALVAMLEGMVAGVEV